MATYRTHNYTPKSTSYEDYMPEYTTYNYTRPSDTYSDNNSPYASDIRNAQNQLSQLERSKPAGYSSAYTDQINTLINNMANRKFNYDVNGDPLYQQYKHSYMTQGKQAMEDTIGQAAAMTGGYGNSYATAAGGQAYQSYLDQLNDRIPELYQLALDRYNTEGSDMQTLYSMMSEQEAQDYNKYRDRVSDYQTDRSHYTDQLQNLRTMGQNLWGQNWDNYWNAADRTDTNRNNAVNAALSMLSQDWDNYHWAEEQTQHNYEQAVSEDQYNSDLAYNYAKLNADTDYNNAYIDYLNNKSSSSSSSSSNSGSSSSGSGGAVKDMSGSSGVKNFESGKLTRDEFSRRSNTTKIGNKNTRFDSYTDYIDALIENWLKTGRLTNNEASYLIDRYL